MTDPDTVSLQFITHACVLLEAGPVRLLCDPWLSGPAFADGWRLLVEPEETISDLAPTHIWLSHEHPDHFSPRDLRAVDRAERAGITVLYQQTADRKIEIFLATQGYPVQVLPPGETVSLAPGVEVICGSMGADSWLVFRAGGRTIVNLNDCITGQDILEDDVDALDASALEPLRTVAHGADLLLTQFSYSNWVGNADDQWLHQRQAQTKLGQVRQQIRRLAPGAVLPFASHVWFSHTENSDHNRWVNRPRRAAEVIVEEGAAPVVLTPGARWTVGAPHDWRPGAAAWDVIYDGLRERARTDAPIVSLDALVAQFGAYQARIKDKNDWSAIVRLFDAEAVPAATIHLWDLGQTVSFHVVAGLQPAVVPAEECDITLGTEMLDYVMRFEWGRGSLLVSARFGADYGRLVRFLVHTQIAYANNIGLVFPDTIGPQVVLDPPSYVARFAEKALVLAAQRRT